MTSSIPLLASEGTYFGNADSFMSDVLVPGAHPYCVDGDTLTIRAPRYEYDLSDEPCGADEDCTLLGGPPDSLPGQCVYL